MDSFAKRVALVGALACAACNPGEGVGEVRGTVTAADCELNDAAYELLPDFFTADSIRESLQVRIQNGSDLQIRSDGLLVTVTDAAEVRTEQLEVPLRVGEGERADVRMSFYLNQTCEKGRHGTPVLMTATSGSVVFHDVYAPEVDDRALRIAADFANVEFVDPYSPSTRHATLSGSFEFIYNRGRPSQRFP